MDNIRATIDVLFNRRRGEEIIDSHFHKLIPDRADHQVDRDWFCRCFRNDYNIYSNDQIGSIYDILKSKWMKTEHSELDSIFNVLIHFSEDVLINENGEPKCRYHHLLRWHEASSRVGEDLLTTSFLAFKDVENGRSRHFFSWKPIIGHDNPAINCIFERGVADLHFHLKGSSLNFDINWLCLMNHIANRRAEFDKLNKLQSSALLTNQEDKIEQLHTLCVKACAIRLFLFAALTDDFFYGDDDFKNSITSVFMAVNSYEVALCVAKLQKKINLIRSIYGHRYGKDVVDYAINSNLTDKHFRDPRYYTNSILSGERWLLYYAFHRIYSCDPAFSGLSTLFYGYLVIKERLRHEFIQLNEKIGFANFAQYEERKELFITKDSIYDVLIANLAINSTERNQNIHYIEARITPKISAALMSSTIRKLDNQVQDRRFMPYIEDTLTREQRKSEKFYYILHFIKSKSGITCPLKKQVVSCRNTKVRQQIKKQAFAITKIRQKHPQISTRIVGIDAANTEIQCRPEVFAQTFRYLREYPYQADWEYLMDLPVGKLGITYHVGEDYLDIVDGLRAIDEALLFLNLKRGDRLGHALALGADAEQYYVMRNKTLVMPKQDFLDNVVWLLIKTKQLGICISPDLEVKLKNWFEQYYVEIYGVENKPSIYIYYQSWLLRGDAPKQYFKETLEKEALSFWDRCSLNTSVQIVNNARNNIDAQRLYFRYHYDYDVRTKGSQSDEYMICPNYVLMVEKLQEAMRYELVKQHICIETNLTSNNVIGFFRRYAAHPITRFYNKGLVANDSKMPQISVSINTDDQGIFSTTIENEFSLIALSLEKQIDKEGNPLYTSRMVYDWLDNIRQLAFEQKFL